MRTEDKMLTLPFGGVEQNTLYAILAAIEQPRLLLLTIQGIR